MSGIEWPLPWPRRINDPVDRAGPRVRSFKLDHFVEIADMSDEEDPEPLFRVIGKSAKGKRRTIMCNLLAHTANTVAATLTEMMPDAEFTVEPRQ